MLKENYTTAYVWMVDKNGERVGRIGKKRIFLHSEDKGVIVTDGREVVKINDDWVFVSM